MDAMAGRMQRDIVCAVDRRQLVIDPLAAQIHVDFALANFDLEGPDVPVFTRRAFSTAYVEHASVQRAFDDVLFEKTGR